jgi:chaperonin GroES
MIERLKAKGINVLVIRDEAISEHVTGLIIPDSAKIKPHTGKIISVGNLVQDKGIKTNDTAVFNKTAGFVLEFPDGDVLVLKEQDIIASL